MSNGIRYASWLKGILEQAQDLAYRQLIKEFITDEEQREKFDKILDVFAKNGVGTDKAIKIMRDLSEHFEDELEE